jgi:hypothetical protein
MTRLRLAALTAVAGAGLAGGCCGIGHGQLLDRLGWHRHCDCECGRLESGPVVGTLTGQVVGDGPVLEDPGACCTPPPVGAVPPAGVLPQPGPMLTPVPTEPPVAQPVPAGPGGAMSRRTVK